MIRSLCPHFSRVIPRIVVADESNFQSGCWYQSVRWRKRRTDPIAKSKIGRVRISSPIDPAEYKFGLAKWDEYRIILDSIRQHCVDELTTKSKETAAGVSLIEQQKKDDEEWQALLAWNDQENAQTRLIREARLKEEAKQAEEKKLQILMEKERQEAEWLQELTEIVRKEKEASKSYITSENLDEAIEAAMANEKDYSFGIDKDGNVTSLPENSAWTELKRRLESTTDETDLEKQEGTV